MSITTPKPCTEKWDNMSPSERGRHCSVCQTEVVDFTDWKTDDIIGYIQNTNKKICGRINRIPNHNWFWKSKSYIRVAASLILSTTIGIKSTQATFKSNKSIVEINYIIQVDSITIKGVVTDQQNNPLVGVPISIDKQYLSSTDAKGHFTLKFATENKEEVSLFFQYIGFKNKIVRIKLKKETIRPLKVILDEDIVYIGEVIVKRPNIWQRFIQSLKKK
ncbi:carboxypeptidase-like regulatory domain-containing protein [Sphingobacterium sp. DN00404]|uniref:Carboxypeptidase-like regulatory domain-containing protein n=1 Tax=Sphingobacterium micropteri TaxID=2763501 RepID=A0ABR7YUA7_9SPHI|nr:carboxypeptidase-like regulatory domain-containing protein [Sphingobacterium micropteri]MBD1434919.1 carboxypeptidase-like regulatory domain-containing protein [Sphingobacterium micropteri]